MLNDEEKRFLAWWEENRHKKNRILRYLYVGMPMAVLLVIAIFVNFMSGWYARANTTLVAENSSLFLVLLVAALGIVAFIVIFSARHRWELHEQQYRELKAREEK